MTSTNGNFDKRLEFLYKTCHIQTTDNNSVHSLSDRLSIAKLSNQQPSRKTSVHDVHEVNKEYFNKTITEIHGDFACLNAILETVTDVTLVRDELEKVKLQLIVKITDLIYRLTNDSRQSSLTSLKESSIDLKFNPRHIAYCIEYFRNQLMKVDYLFSSLTLSTLSVSSTLDNLVIKSLTSIDLQLTHKDAQNNEDIIGIRRDISNLDEYMYLFNQRYGNHITDNVTGETTTMTGEGKSLTADNALNNQQARNPIVHKLSIATSTSSTERSSFCARVYRKCQMICCICTPSYM